MDTNTIAEAVVEAQGSLSTVNVTLIWIAVIQGLVGVLTAWTAILSKIILKDVNSDRSARVKEVQDLNDKLKVVEKLNTLLSERERVSEEVATVENAVEDAVVKKMSTLLTERERITTIEDKDKDKAKV